MSSFDDDDRRAKYAVVPKSTTHGQVVKLDPKKLATRKEVRTVLPEEQYLNRLEKIIVKDFFPELPKLKAQAEYMDAQANNDLAKMRELQLRYNTVKRTDRRTSPSARMVTSPMHRAATSPIHFDPDTPGPSRGNETPLPFVNREGDNERQKSKKAKAKKDKPTDSDSSLSVDAYLNKFTSEDNASFEELTELQWKRECAKNAWIYDAEKKHNKEMVVRATITSSDADMQLALRGDPVANEAKPIELDGWEYRARNNVLWIPEDAPMTVEERVAAAKRAQRVINKDATRFPEDVKNRSTEASMARAAIQQAANNAGKVDVLGREVGVDPKQLGLLATPSPAPGVDASPLMTWGEIDGTPFRLDATDVTAPADNAPVFKMPEIPYREQIAQKMSDDLALKYRAKRKTAMETAERAHKTPKFGSARSSDVALSPAARRLVTNKLGIRLGSSGKPSRTPTPGVISARTPGSSHSFASPRTPIASMIKKRASTAVATPRSTPRSTSSITDDLMPVATEDNLSESRLSAGGGRAKAGDFF